MTAQKMMARLAHTRFMWGGRDLGDGVDCWGACVAVLKEYGIDIKKDWSPIKDNWEEVEKIIKGEQASSSWQEIDIDDANPPAVILMGKSHIGVLTDEGVLHMTKKHGAVLQSVAVIKIIYRGVRAYKWVG